MADTEHLEIGIGLDRPDCREIVRSFVSTPFILRLKIGLSVLAQYDQNQ